ncbi:hypothetical protein GCM10017674_50540 [Streptomyces gardneri]|uniref:Uncharacterized protein n=1 Tax=Streptomyces gardneri TaxID=66892 RepID=A0A4Y3RTP4_9ACTN|nr:hypothetical protein SGA01_62790 [Streptomyces gardneri]GHH08184.1 hypothetical protein GCM10017674_50540 [Streptomyces gardneri]
MTLTGIRSSSPRANDQSDPRRKWGACRIPVIPVRFRPVREKFPAPTDVIIGKT